MCKTPIETCFKKTLNHLNEYRYKRWYYQKDLGHFTFLGKKIESESWNRLTFSETFRFFTEIVFLLFAFIYKLEVNCFTQCISFKPTTIFFTTSVLNYQIIFEH